MMTKTNHYFRVLAVLAILVMVASLLTAAARSAEAAFSGLNGRILFTSNRTTGQGVDNPQGDQEIFSMNSDGTGVKQLTKNGQNDTFASWSPNGQRIAFTSWRDGNAQVYTMNAADGSNQTNRTDNLGLDAFPDWQPYLFILPLP